MQNSDSSASAMSAWRMQGNHSVIPKNALSESIRDPSNRRRNQLACEMCYKKKIKCEVEGSNPSCIHCMRRNITCKFVSRKEKRENLKRTRYVRSLEERLRKTESLLKAAGLFHDDLVSHDDTSDDEDEYFEGESEIENEEDENLTASTRMSNRRNFGESDRGRNRVPVEQDPTSTPSAASSSAPSLHPSLGFITSANPSECKRSQAGKATPHAASAFKMGLRENSQYYGRSSPFSILTREVIEWIKDKSGEVKYLEILLSNSNKSENPCDYWRSDVFHDVFSSTVFKPLPPRAEVFTLIRDYFRTVNRIFPLYHEATFMELVEWQYTQQTCDDAARWASINIILSLAYEYRFSNSQKSEKDRERGWLYYKNAFSVFPELSLRRIDLLSIQALLGMALFLRGNSGTQSTVPIITAAIRAAHRMGLHRDIPRPGISEVEQEQRKRVFWIAYILDQSTCVRLGNAPAQHFDDFDIDYPSNDADEGLVMPNQHPFFPRICRISMIKSRIYGRLYSTRALENKSAAEICDIMKELHAELEEWKGNSRFDISLKKQRGAGDDFMIGFASAGMDLVYYSSLIMIHRLPPILNVAYKVRLDNGDPVALDAQLMLDQASASAAVCVQAARDTLKLVNNLPWGDIAWIWPLLYYVFLAVMTIFVSLLRNSQLPTAKDDLQSLNMASTFFATLLPADGSCSYARFLTTMSSNFERIARAVIERDQKAVRPVTDSTKNIKHPEFRYATSTSNNQKPLHLDRNDDYERAQSADYPTSTNSDIPNLDGLPPINSHGYVVRESPSDTPTGNPDFPHTASNSPSQNTTPQVINNNVRLGSIHPQNQHHHLPPPEIEQPPNNPFVLENMFFPFSAHDSMSFAQPELWHIPFTEEWEIGTQFLNGMFGQPASCSVGTGTGGDDASSTPTTQDSNFFFQGAGGGRTTEPMMGVINASTTAAGGPGTNPSTSMHSAAMGGSGRGGFRGYGTQGGFAPGPNSSSNSNLNPGMMWMSPEFGPTPF